MTQLALIPARPVPGRYLASAAVLSPCGLYRYSLARAWDLALPRLLVCGLNPSTAAAMVDDPTIRREVGFARAWGFGALEKVNAYGWRATNPRELRGLDPAVAIGPDNDKALELAAARCQRIVVAWGQNVVPGRAAQVEDLLARFGDLWRIGSANTNGSPRHPLYLAGSTPLELHRPRST